MKFGHRVSGKIESIDEKGRGVFTSENVTFSVPFAAVGDEVTATFQNKDRGTKVAKIESVDVPGPDRVATPCPHAGTCGGCLWQHIAYDAQLKLKLDMVNKAFEAAGHDERVTTVEPAVEQFHHRNRMDYVVGWNAQVGLKEYGSWNKYVDLKTCLLLNDGVGEILQTVRDWMKECDIQPWDAKYYNGDVRYVVIREGKETDQRLIVVVVHSFDRISEDARRKLKTQLVGQAQGRAPTSLLLGEQSLPTDISLAQKFIALHGEPWLEEVVNDVRYRIHPNSFFQTNSKMAGRLQEVVASYVIPNEREGSSNLKISRSARNDKMNILDLYCGLGFFGIYLAKSYEQRAASNELRVHGVEIDAEAIELAKHNAKVNGVSERTEFVAAKAEDMSWKDIPADVVILDPPRSGLHPRVLAAILEKKPKTIVYVSCNFKRLVEELKELKKIYAVEKLAAADLFPHTPHVEVIVRLSSRLRSCR